MKALQKKWYQKLKDSGFTDIEDTTSQREYLKTWHSTYFYLRYTPQTFQWKADYYRRASAFYHDFPFDDAIEKECWGLHAEGKSYREIGKLMNLKPTSAGKRSVHKIITKYRITMKNYPLDLGDE